MWYSSRADDDGRRIRPSTNTATYQHRDVGNDQPSQRNRAQVVQQHFITPGQHWHVKRTGYTFSLKNIELPLFSLNEALCSNVTKVE